MKRASDKADEPFKWDWTLAIIVIGIVLIVLVLTFELWAPHYVPDR